MAGALGLALAGPRRYHGVDGRSDRLDAATAAPQRDGRRHPPRPARSIVARLRAAARRCVAALIALLADLAQRATGDLQQPVEVEMALEMIGERVERRFDLRLVGDARHGPRAERRRERRGGSRRGEEAVQIAAGDAAVGRYRALGVAAPSSSSIGRAQSGPSVRPRCIS